MNPIVAVQGITRRFPGVLALDDVSLAIFPGEIHALLGENGAGKSTLMNVLAGEVLPDAGHIVFDGRRVHISSPLVAQKLGIGVVYQELALCPNLTIADNIALNHIATRPAWSFIRRRRFEDEARQVLGRLGLHTINPRQVAGRLSVAQQQLVEIARAISRRVRVLILDEPNSALTSEETAHLFQVLEQLRADGVAIIYVSHRLEEVLQIADRISVMRDGRLIDTLPNDHTTTIESLIARMVGRAVNTFRKHSRAELERAEVAFSVSDFSSPGAFHGLRFDLHAGEVLGIAGLPDSGKDELVEALFGLRPASGHLRLHGRPLVVRSPQAALRQGLALIPADRRGAGALLTMSVEDNTAASTLRRLSAGGVLRRGAIRRLSQQYVQQFGTRISGHYQKMRTLSGGNQQKVILARGLATGPQVLLLHEPTRGIDVGAKAEIYAILHHLAAAGMSILIVSSEMSELVSQCDRLIVLHMGRISGEFDHASMLDEESVLASVMGQSQYLAAQEGGQQP
ncbi:MAG: sugar ABC transporter ATP-binding protein [Anaerolineae bacterium]|jgi:ribose transport system ATP-binding protein|nr:sugar ABC transporter ATP-binding protein [Anaerolineae bacterium]